MNYFSIFFHRDVARRKEDLIYNRYAKTQEDRFYYRIGILTQTGRRNYYASGRRIVANFIDIANGIIEQTHMKEGINEKRNHA